MIVVQAPGEQTAENDDDCASRDKRLAPAALDQEVRRGQPRRNESVGPREGKHPERCAKARQRSPGRMLFQSVDEKPNRQLEHEDEGSLQARRSPEPDRWRKREEKAAQDGFAYTKACPQVSDE